MGWNTYIWVLEVRVLGGRMAGWGCLRKPACTVRTTVLKMYYCVCFVADLDDVQWYSAHSKPHRSPLDFRINAFYFLPSTLHAASVSRPLQQSPVKVTQPVNHNGQFDDVELT